MGAAAGAAQVGVGGLQMVEAGNQAKSLKRQASFNARQQEFNAALTGMQISEVEKQSKKDIQARESDVNKMIGEQKVSFAGQGVDLDSEVVGLLEDEERSIGAEDVQNIKNNAWREAMGLEISQRDQMAGAQVTRMEGRENARQAAVAGMLGGASSIIGGLSKFSPGKSNNDYTNKKSKRSVGDYNKFGSNISRKI